MRRQLALLLALVWAVAVAFVACDEDGGDGDGDSDIDSDADFDWDDDFEDGPLWTKEVVNGDEVGRFSSLDVGPTGTVGVAYYGFVAETGGPCDITIGERDESRVPIYYSYLDSGAAAWETELVHKQLHLGDPVGLSFRFAPDGTPSLATFGGEAFDVLCGANDVVLWTRDASKTWSAETAATASGGAGLQPDDTCPAEAANKGYTVGSWPGLAFDKAGRPAIMYRDTHFGTIQSDDIRRADAEMVHRTGGWAAEMVLCGEAGGRDNACVFDTEDRFVGFHRVTLEAHLEDLHGLWAHRRETDGTWTRFMLVSGQVSFGEGALVAGPDNTVSAIYYDPRQGRPYLTELVDPTRFADGIGWLDDGELSDTRYDEGDYPSIARHPDGRIAVAYYRCRRSGSSLDTCDDDSDAVVFAWRSTAGNWTREIVDSGSRGQCGTNISLEFDSDGVAWISYVCVRNIAGSEFVHELKVAHRRPL